MRGTLTVNSGPAAGLTMPVEGEIVIGRVDADVTLDDAEVSRRHAAIRPGERGLEIEDLGSTNGTYVDGRRISQPVIVTAAAMIDVGGSRIVVEPANAAMTRIRPTPVAPADQATRAAEVVQSPPVGAEPAPAAPEPAPAAAEPAPPPTPPAQQPPAATPPGEPPQAEEAAAEPPGDGPPGRRMTPRVLLAVGAAAVAVVVGVVAVILLGGDSEETTAHRLDAAIVTLPLADATSTQVSGELRGSPLGRVAVVVHRRLEEAPRAGGEAVPLRGFMLVTAPSGVLSLHFTGTLELTRSGGEVVAARGAAANGTGDYQGLEGAFRLTGGRPDDDSAQSRLRVTGTLEY